MNNYNNSNNASTTISAGISASATTLLVDNGAILPNAPFLLTLEHMDNEKVTVREIVKCTVKIGNSLTIVRSAGICVQDDTATPKVQNNTPHSFGVGDFASIYWTSEQVKDIQDEINQKLNITDFQAGTYVYSSSSTETDAYSITIPGTITSYQLGQVFRFMADVENTGPATLNVNCIGAIEIKKNHDIILESGDIEAGQIVEVAYDGTYFQMNSQVATVVDLGNIDSLKMSGVVGELYTLDDELYIQDVSEDLKSEEGINVINVGYDKEETHIQRIANGTIGNSISLYVAKVGSPTTNFTVEIRKGIYAEADGRAYWTGDSTQILASKSISYSSFTTDFQKITITFDDNIELQRGDLIDIVCYQSGVGDEKVKSTTNYFSIEGYGNKLGEGNSVNYVDNGTITPTLLIAYCQSDMFENKVFSKATLGITTTANFKKEIQGSGTIKGASINPPTYIRMWSYTARSSNITMRVKGSADLNRASFGYVADGGNETEITSSSGRSTKTFDTQVTFNSNITFYVKCTDNSTPRENAWDFTVEYSDISTNKWNIIGKPSSIIPISNEIGIITEGEVNGERYSQHKNEQPGSINVAYLPTRNEWVSYTLKKSGIYKINYVKSGTTTIKLNGIPICVDSGGNYGDPRTLTIYDGFVGDIVDIYGGPNYFTITYVTRNISLPA